MSFAPPSCTVPQSPQSTPGQPTRVLKHVPTMCPKWVHRPPSRIAPHGRASISSGHYTPLASDGSTTLMPSIGSNLVSVGNESGIDPRILLAVLMQESSGNVAPVTTYGRNRNTGMMQADNGSTFSLQDPERSIYLMIRDGAMGTGNCGACLANHINQYGNIWDALAVYNQGELGANLADLDQPGCCTQHYVQVVANRLHGWVDPWIGRSNTVRPYVDSGLLAGSTSQHVESSWSHQHPTRSASTSTRSRTVPDVYWVVTNSAFLSNVHWYNATHHR